MSTSLSLIRLFSVFVTRSTFSSNTVQGHSAACCFGGVFSFIGPMSVQISNCSFNANKVTDCKCQVSSFSTWRVLYTPPSVGGKVSSTCTFAYASHGGSIYFQGSSSSSSERAINSYTAISVTFVSHLKIVSSPAVMLLQETESGQKSTSCSSLFHLYLPDIGGFLMTLHIFINV
jgi:hypothetical protein